MIFDGSQGLLRATDSEAWPHTYIFFWCLNRPPCCIVLWSAHVWHVTGCIRRGLVDCGWRYDSTRGVWYMHVIGCFIFTRQVHVNVM